MRKHFAIRKVISEREVELPETHFVEIMKIAEEEKGVISLGPGEPDFVTPKHIRDYAKKMLDKGYTHYTAIGGMSEVKEVIAKKLKRKNRIDASPEEIIITVGGKEAILLSLMVLVDPGESVIVPNPGYMMYIPMIESLNGVPLSVALSQNENFEYNIDKIKEILHTQKTRALILNSPSNPTGTVFNRKKLEEIADFAVENKLVVISDEAYEDFVYDGAKHVSIGSLNGMEEYVISIFTCSKSYAMPGFRIGYATGHPELIKAMTRLKLGTTLSTPTISQLAAVAALNGSNKPVKKMVSEYNRRRKLVMKRLNGISAFKTLEPRGAFYVFPNIEQFGMSSVKFSEFLLKKAKVLVVPGNEFGKYGEGFVRISYATAYEKIEEAMDRIEKLFREAF